MEYPKYMYVKSDCEKGFSAVLLKSKEEELALGECWDSPVKVPAKTYREHQAEWKSKEEKEEKPKRKRGQA